MDTKAKKWTINKSIEEAKRLTYNSNRWDTIGKTGKSYSFDSIRNGISIFDNVKLTWSYSLTNPKFLFTSEFAAYNNLAQVLLPNGQILYIGGTIDSAKLTMDKILTYDTVTDNWQMTVRKKIFSVKYN